jgi:hypothetical protein
MASWGDHPISCLGNNKSGAAKFPHFRELPQDASLIAEKQMRQMTHRMPFAIQAGLEYGRASVASDTGAAG